jgi:uncharacterized protein YwgA
MSQITERQKKLFSIVVDLPQKDVSLVTLQKIVFLCKLHVKTCDISYRFKKSHFGPFSQEIVSDIDELESKGFLKIEKGNRIVIVKTISEQEKWNDAEKTVSEFNQKFPNNSSIIVSALSAPNVINKSVGEPIEA